MNKKGAVAFQLLPQDLNHTVKEGYPVLAPILILYNWMSSHYLIINGSGLGDFKFKSPKNGKSNQYGRV